MDILISHWHCIIPAIAILLAMFFLRSKNTGYGAAVKGSAADANIRKPKCRIQAGVCP